VPYIANARQPYIANARQPYIANGQQPFSGNAQNPFTYPFLYLAPYPYYQPFGGGGDGGGFNSFMPNFEAR